MRNSEILPAGSICGHCERYIGSKLETHIAAWPPFALQLQFNGVPGKDDRPRRNVGSFTLTRTNAGRPQLSMQARVHRVSGVKRVVDWEVAPSAAFRLSNFRRAAHCVAFHSLMRSRGIPFARSARFAPVRNYIRSANTGDTWPFAALERDDKTVPRIVGTHIRSDLPGLAIGIQVFRSIVVVDLGRHPDFEKAAKAAGLDVWAASATRVPPLAFRYVER